MQQQQTSFFETPLGKTIFAILLPVVTFAILYFGFIFLRDDKNTPQAVITIFAIVWGVGGVALLFFAGNWLVERLPEGWTQRIQPFIFVGPALLLLGWYLMLPTVRSLITSLYDRRGNFIGIDNYTRVLTDRINVEAWTNNLLWMILGTTLVVVLGLVIAILSDRSRFERVAKSFIFMPMAISMVGAGVIWKFVYDTNPNIGLLNAVVKSSGGETQSWLTLFQPWNNYFLIITMVWLQTGYTMVLISAAIKGIPDELLEAARVDGANEWLIFFRIILPNIAGTLLTSVTTVVIFTLKIFDIVMVMTGGQFGTEVIGVRFYRERFTNNDPGMASAIAIVLLLAVVPVMIYNLREFSKREAF